MSKLVGKVLALLAVVGTFTWMIVSNWTNMVR